MEQRWSRGHRCQQSISPCPAPKMSPCRPRREAQPGFFQGEGSRGWCQREPRWGLCAAPASSCGIFTALTHLVSPGPQRRLLHTGGCCPGRLQSAPRARRKPRRIAPRQLQFSPPKCLISPFLQHLGAVVRPGPQLQGQARSEGQGKGSSQPCCNHQQHRGLGAGERGAPLSSLQPNQDLASF